MLRMFLGSLFLLRAPEGEGAGGTPPADGGTGGAGGTGSPPPAKEGGAGTGNPWFHGFTAEDVRGYIGNKGFKDPEALALAYMNLEKTRGVPQERLITLPSDDKPESWAPIFTKLGRPEKVDGYELKQADGVPETFMGWQRQVFHELGLTKKQGESLSSKWNELLAQDQKTTRETEGVALQQQIESLKTEWGAAAGQNADIVDKMVLALGLDEAKVKSIEKVLGFDGFSKLMIDMTKKFGIKLGEDDFHAGGGGPGGTGQLTPAEAKAKRDELTSNPDWMKAWQSGDLAKIKEYDRLSAMIYRS